MTPVIESVYCEKVQTIKVDKMVFTQGENVANRTFLSDGKSNDNERWGVKI